MRIAKLWEDLQMHERLEILPDQRDLEEDPRNYSNEKQLRNYNTEGTNEKK